MQPEIRRFLHGPIVRGRGHGNDASLVDPLQHRTPERRQIRLIGRQRNRLCGLFFKRFDDRWIGRVALQLLHHAI